VAGFGAFPWVGSAGVPPPARAGYRPLGWWAGGAGVPPAAAVHCGFRSHCWWSGGAGVPPEEPAGEAGYRSMLAWWTGGAGANITAGPPTPQPIPVGGGTFFPLPPDIRRALRMRLIEEDDLLLLLVASQFSKRLQ
jgi:hypothetical protein